MNYYETLYKTYNNIAGVDEVGRGCLFGPVVAAAVILPKDFDYKEINDSKKLTAKQREIYYDYILSHCISYAVTEIDNVIIDEINILQASKLAMIKSINALDFKPDFVLIDAVKLDIDIPRESIIKGDAKSYTIAAASIIAKVYRDRLLKNLAIKYPYYSLETNMGYGTKKHLEGINQYGVTRLHRMSFEPIKSKCRKCVI